MLNLLPPLSRNALASSSRLISTRYIHANLPPQAEAKPIDKEDEEVQRILREYGVDPDEIGDERSKRKKERDRVKGVEDYNAWKDWDGMVDRKDVGQEVEWDVKRERGGTEKRQTETASSSSNANDSNSLSRSAVAASATTSVPPPDSVSPSAPSPSSLPHPNPSQSLESALQARLTNHIQSLRSEADSLRRTLSIRTEHLKHKASERAQVLKREAGVQFGLLGGRINGVTGYDEVEKLKAEVTEKEQDISRLRAIARESKLAYDLAVTTRTDSQRQVNSLLERKHSWTDTDVMEFTKLVRADHSSNASVGATQAALAKAEEDVEKAFDALMRSILNRYHEEQVWSDKIRSVSTYGSLIVLLVNLIVFLGAIVVVEPWKRRRLVRGLEERVKGMMEEVQGRVGGDMEEIKILLSGVQAGLGRLATIEEKELNLVPKWIEDEIVSASIATTSLPTEPTLTIHPSPHHTLMSPSIISSISANLSRLSPSTSLLLQRTDPHHVDLAVTATASVLLGGLLTGAMMYCRS